MEKRYKEIDGVRYQVIQNTILGSNVVPVGETLPEVTVSDSGKVLTVNSSGEWDAASVPSELPAVAGNAGKVLKVNSGATGVEWDNESTELPVLTGNAGKVLKVNSGATGVEWDNESTELPAVTSADEGDVLTVNASGQWAKAAPSGGGAVYLSATFEHLGKSYNDILDYIQSGTSIYFIVIEQGYNIIFRPIVYYANDGHYYVTVISWQGEGTPYAITYTASSASQELTHVQG